MDNYPTEEEIINYKNNIDFVFSEYAEINYSIVMEKYVAPFILHIVEIHKDRTSNKSEIPFLFFATLFVKDTTITIEFIDGLYNFCIQKRVNFYSFIQFLLGWDFSELNRITRNKIEFINDTVEEYYQNVKNFDKLSLLEYITENLQRVHSYRPTEHNLVEEHNFYQKV
jgi:hypothetical protein